MKLTFADARKLGRTPLVVIPMVRGERPVLPEGVEVPAAFWKGFEADPRSTRLSYASSGPAEAVLLLGLGAAEDVDTEGLRRAAAVAAKRAEEHGASKATLLVSDALAERAGGPAAVGEALAEGLSLGAYRYHECKTDAPAASCKAFALASPTGAFRKGAKRGVVRAAACAFARDLQNRPANRLRPRDMAAEAMRLAARSPKLRCTVLDEKELARLKAGLFLSVSKGSTEPARLIHLVHKPKGRSRGRIALVGKGLTFDAGGYSLKPSAKMDEMRFDMSGGAAVLGVFHALAELDVPFEVHGVVGASENLIDGCASKPGDVYAAMDGTTVEIMNTDAEGRLVLADCLCYVTRKVKPDTTIDLATLTGAVIVALGHEASGLFCDDEGLRDALLEAGEAVGERCWPLPLLPSHKAGMKGKSADLTNLGPGSLGAGSSQGAAFLSYFVPEGQRWCHLDIAGTAWGAENRDWVGGAGGTGVGTRLLLEYLVRRD